MYSPDFYREVKIEPILQLIEKYSFATLFTADHSESISHLPFILENNPKRGSELLSHMAKANPHWQELEGAGKAKVIFQGPHGYISPAWYVPSPGNVPTWNYAVVHATGEFEILREEALRIEIMNKLVGKFEGVYGTGWQLPADELAIERLMNEIVIFRIHNLSFESKFKLSQKQSHLNRSQVIKGLQDLESPSLTDLADYMKNTDLPS